MKLVVVGMNHHTAPLDVREHFAFSNGDLPAALGALKSHLGQGVLLSTCNRTEVYILASSATEGKTRIEQFFTHVGRETGRATPYLQTLEHLDAVRYLFRVACGLDSMILGETEVLGQVRGAYGAAVANGAAGGILSHVFHHALRVGKRARTETGISRNPLSISSACVELARRTLGDLSNREVIVIGLGEAGSLAAQALASSGIGSLWVTNRTYHRAEELATQLDGTPVPFERLEEMLARVDIVISTTGAPRYILDAQTIARVMERRHFRPLFLVDIAVPRDIDPQAASVQGVALHDMEDLEAISSTNRLQRQQEADRVESIVVEEVERFGQWWKDRGIVPTVASLRRQADRIRQEEIAKTLRRLPHLAPEDQHRLDALTKAITKKLLHNPIALLKNSATEADVQLVRSLFHLDEERDPADE